MFLFLFFTLFLLFYIYSITWVISMHFMDLITFKGLFKLFKRRERERDWSNIYAWPNAVSLFIFVVSIKIIFPREYYSKTRRLFCDASEIHWFWIKNYFSNESLKIRNPNHIYDTFTLKWFIDKYKNTIQNWNLLDICTKFSSWSK